MHVTGPDWWYVNIGSINGFVPSCSADPDICHHALSLGVNNVFKSKPVHMSNIQTRVSSVNIKAHMLKDIFLASRISLLFNLAFFVISQFWHLTLGLLDVACTWQDWQVKWVVLSANKETFIYCTLQLSASYTFKAWTWSSLCLQMAWYLTEHTGYHCASRKPGVTSMS